MKTKTGKTRLILAAAAAMSLTVSLVGCGTSTSPSSGSSKDGASDSHVSVAMGLILTGLQYFQDEKDGAEAWAAEDQNVDLEITGPPGFDPALAQKQVVDMLAKGPDAMGISPQPPESWRRTIQDLVTRLDGKVISYSEVPVTTPEEAAKSPIQTVVGNADRALTRDMLEATIQRSGLPASTTGTVILAPCTPDLSGTQGRRLDGLTDAVKKLLPNANIVTFVTTPTNAQENHDLWSAKLAIHPDAVLAAGACPVDAESLYRIKKEKGYPYAMGAMDLTPDIIAGVKDGSILAANASNTWLMGYTTARMLTLAARGEALPKGFVGTGGSLFMKDNIGDAEQRSSDPKTYFQPLIDKMFANGMPTAAPIENAWQ